MPSTAALPPLERELALASDAARRAGTIQMERYERLERIVHKSERDVVTEVDQLCEDLILGAVRAAFPTDASLSEEAAHAEATSNARRPPRRSGARAAPGRTATNEVAAAAGRMWIVDPLDGTVNYANGIPIFCVSIALAVDGRPAVGVIYDPARDELFSAVVGAGATLDGEPIHLPVKEKLSDCVVSFSMARGYTGRGRKLLRAIRVSRVLGSASLSLAYVANGRFDAFVQVRGLSLWDVAAAGLIAAEAGAQVSDGSGEAWFDIGGKSRDVGIIAAAPVHHTAIRELLA